MKTSSRWYWLAPAALLACAPVVFWTNHKPSRPEPVSTAELTDRLKPLGWHETVVSPNCCYESVQPLPPADLYATRSRPDDSPGVVYFQRLRDGWKVTGDHDMVEAALRQLHP